MCAPRYAQAAGTAKTPAGTLATMLSNALTSVYQFGSSML